MTRNALHHALAEKKHDADERIVTTLMAAYDRLSTCVLFSVLRLLMLSALVDCRFNDAQPTLEALAGIPDVDFMVFSNGWF